MIATDLLGQVRNIPKERRFTPEMGGAPLEEGAATPLYLALSAEVTGVSGGYFENSDAVPSSAETLDENKARRLWQMSETLCGLTS